MPELADWLRLARAPFDPGHLLFLPVVASSLALALLVQRRRRAAGARGELFPARLYRSAAFRLDLRFALVNQALYGALVSAFVLGTDAVAGALSAGVAALGLRGPGLAFGVTPQLAFVAALFAARDLGVYVAHALQHRVPLLWAFHRVHHTTTALTPAAAFRAHPVDDVLVGSLAAFTSGVVAAAFRFVFGEAVSSGTVIGTGFLVLGFHLAGHHLRHSHVWLSYGPVLGRVLVSPAHHQVHHSRAPRHWNRNLGQFLALWDWAFGTLYVPGRVPEAIAYGVSSQEDARFHSVPRLYLLPFADAAGLLARAAARALGLRGSERGARSALR